jgi:pyruvate/2-oxoglutarate/acetoin dehydrogenase E1 component
MKDYFNEICRSMTWLSEQDDTMFIGQTVEYPGTALSNTVKHLPKEKLYEMPVCEDMQMGMTIGIAMNGSVPISIFPRWNFLLLGTNQIVNHLDKLKLMLPDNCNLPKIIIRTSIGSINPLYPGPQHIGDFTDVFRLMCPNINVVRLDSTEMIFPSYKEAYERQDGRSTLIVEWADAYDPVWCIKRAREIS